MGKREGRKCPGTLSNCTHLRVHKVQPLFSSPASCPITGLPALLSCGNTHQHRRHTPFAIPLYHNSVFFSWDIFQEKQRRGREKNWEKDFCFLASLELSTERCHHTTKLANKPQTKQKALFSQEQGAPQNQMPPKYPNDSKSIVD